MVRLGYFLALGLACILACWIAYKAWTNRGTTGARPLVGTALATAIWAGGTIGLLWATSPAAELRWLQGTYLGIVGAPISFFVLALEYTGYNQYLTRATVGSLLAVGGVFLGLAWTNPLHHLYWTEIDYTAAVPAGATTSPAPGFWGFVVFTYLLLLVGSLLFARYALTAPHLYRSQTILILSGIAAPWAANIPHSLQLMAADYTPVALSVTTVALWGAMYQYRLTDLGPIALRTVFESISTGVYVLDRHDRVVDLNAAGKEMLEVSDEGIGSPFRDLISNDELYEHFRDVDDHREVVAVERNAPSGEEDSEVYYYEIRVTPIETARGKQEGRLFVLNDVTDQHRQQQQLERQNEQLEAFTSMVSHDLRNPLNVASGNVALAQEECDTDYLDHAARALSRMATLIDDLLALAHSGIKITDPEPVDLATVVADAWDTVDTKRAALVNEATNQIVADRSRLHQLIENLIRNAVEHGGDSVTVTVKDHDDGFSIADDGRGIPADDREVIFETGYSTNEKGTGLGLSIVKEIADAHGWTIQLAERGDGGAQFDITGVECSE